MIYVAEEIYIATLKKEITQLSNEITEQRTLIAQYDETLMESSLLVKQLEQKVWEKKGEEETKRTHLMHKLEEEISIRKSVEKSLITCANLGDVEQKSQEEVNDSSTSFTNYG